MRTFLFPVVTSNHSLAFDKPGASAPLPRFTGHDSVPPTDKAPNQWMEDMLY